MKVSARFMLILTILVVLFNCGNSKLNALEELQAKNAANLARPAQQAAEHKNQLARQTEENGRAIAKAMHPEYY
ncbi:hypothetical protein DdX_15373 [Ditylenchus destructor]|uniref:Uncharacterized protein n=1 Tax=Ditylenchus destructor TaxID=166010 RepID=A0AAD4MSL9_9BILA|nr:hypothetical protein DdX_15373 [Ditylenchus destructor]